MRTLVLSGTILLAWLGCGQAYECEEISMPNLNKTHKLDPLWSKSFADDTRKNEGVV